MRNCKHFNTKCKKKIEFKSHTPRNSGKVMAKKREQEKAPQTGDILHTHIRAHTLIFACMFVCWVSCRHFVTIFPCHTIRTKCSQPQTIPACILLAFAKHRANRPTIWLHSVAFGLMNFPHALLLSAKLFCTVSKWRKTHRLIRNFPSRYRSVAHFLLLSLSRSQ